MHPRVQQALENRQFFKLICGASYRNLDFVETLAFVFSSAGAHVIDIGARPELVQAVKKGIDRAHLPLAERPLIMVSVGINSDAPLPIANGIRHPYTSSRPMLTFILTKMVLAFKQIAKENPFTQRAGLKLEVSSLHKYVKHGVAWGSWGLWSVGHEAWSLGLGLGLESEPWDFGVGSLGPEGWRRGPAARDP